MSKKSLSYQQFYFILKLIVKFKCFLSFFYLLNDKNLSLFSFKQTILIPMFLIYIIFIYCLIVFPGLIVSNEVQ